MPFPHWSPSGDVPRPPPPPRWRSHWPSSTPDDSDVDDDPFEDPDSPLLADDDMRRLGLCDDDDADPAHAAVCGDGAPPPWRPPDLPIQPS